MPDEISCEEFGDILIRYQNYDFDIVKEVTPVQGWVGHVASGPWPEGTGGGGGVSQIFHRINRMFPDLSGCWTDVQAAPCVGTPCHPTAKKVGFGYTQDEFHEQTASYETDLFCFDLIMSASRAQEQFDGVIEGLREATLWVTNHRFRTEALRVAKRKILASDLLTPATWTSATDGCETLTLNALPTSTLTIQILQRFVSILTGEGYVGKNPLPNQLMFELVTDNITGNFLVEKNPTLKDFLRVSTPEMFGQLFKYGITSAVGNFGIRFDLWPLRYQIVSGTTINLVLPYDNTPATAGIKAEYNDSYDQARIQVDYIWHKMAMTNLTRMPQQVNPQMPFATRDFGGKWKFAMDNLTCRDEAGNISPVDNMRRNQGKFFADWRMATKATHPEWGVAFFSLRELSCLANSTPCQDAYPYVTQDYSSSNTPCPNADIDFTLCALGDGEDYQINGVTCDGVPLLETPPAASANIAAVVSYLNTNFSALGTWSNPSGVILRLAGSTCANPDVTIVCS